MDISIFGLGYVGSVTSACLAQRCNNVIGVDIDERKLNMIREGKSPIVEDELDDLMTAMVQASKIKATSDCDEAVANSELSMVCVGTPSRYNGSLDTAYVERVCYQIGTAIKAKGKYHSVVIRSTVLPGTTMDVLKPMIEQACGGVMGQAFGLSMNPEFLREGSSVRDFADPPFTIIGTEDPEEYTRVAKLYDGLPGEMIHVPITTAEAVKYTCNLFHAVKITFANEIGMVCRRLGVDARQVMRIMAQDTKLNISSRYLTPGFAFGGSCLPKDLRAFTYAGKHTDAVTPMLDAILASNKLQVEAIAERIMACRKRRIALLGISFKPGTDDLRESPLLTLAELLLGRGFEVCVADPNVNYAALHGANKRYIESELPHLKRVLCPIEDAVAEAEILVVGHHTPAVLKALEASRDDQIVFDLVGQQDLPLATQQYEGIYW